jgi:DNA-directed RNA polymerase specialized sigma24 family protein
VLDNLEFTIKERKMMFRPFSRRADFEATADKIGAAFVKFHQPLFYFAFQQLQNKTRAEDAVSIAFIECWRDLSKTSKVEDIEDDLYEHVQFYCHRYLNQFYRDRVLSDVFNREISVEELELKKIEAKTVQQLAN